MLITFSAEITSAIFLKTEDNIILCEKEKETDKGDEKEKIIDYVVAPELLIIKTIYSSPFNINITNSLFYSLPEIPPELS